MKISVLAPFLFLICSVLPVHAATHSDPTFQDGVMISFTTLSDDQARRYTIQVGSNFFVLEPTISGKTAGSDAAIIVGTIGYGALFLHHRGVLNNQLPGTHVQIRSKGNDFEVKIGKKSSLYSLVSAR